MLGTLAVILKKTMEIKQGDIFITKLERDFYGALKVIKRGKSFFEEMESDLLMVGVLDFISKEKPKLTDLKGCKILLQQKLSQNEYRIDFITSDLKYNNLKNYEYLGNIELTEFEKNIPFKLGNGREGINGGFGMSGSMHPNYPNQVFLEWRWRNEREEFEKEIAEQAEKSRLAREEYRKRNMKPKKMLPDNEFWEVIEKINWEKEDDDERMQPAIKFLTKKKVSEIKQFQENLTYKLYQLDTKEHAKNIGEDAYKNDNSYFSVDYFLYVRCCVVANGKDYFKDVLENPKEMPKNLDFEPLLYIAEEAYELRMNKDFDYDTGCDYETYSNYKAWK